MYAKQSKSQSLIETIVAIGIVVIAIVAILSVGLLSTILGGHSSERVQATNLAREGLEVVYAIVDSNRLDPAQSWPFGATNGDWIVNYNDTSLSNNANNPSIADCTNCYLCRQVNDLFTHTDCSSYEVFLRMVSISAGDNLGGNCSNCEKKLVSTVYWLERGRAHTLNLESRLTDWR